MRLWEYVHEEAVDVCSAVLDMTIFGQSHATICTRHHNYVQEKKTKVRPTKNFMQQQQKFAFSQFICAAKCTILTSF